MSRGQFFTVFTIGFSTAIALVGVLVGAATFFFWQTAVWVIAFQLGELGPYVTPLRVALSMSVGGVILAYLIFQAQQSIAHWAANRAIARLERQYREIEQALGTEQAQAFVKAKGIEMLSAPGNAPFGLFSKQEIRDALAAGRHDI